MRAILIGLGALVTFALAGARASSAGQLPKFMGRTVTVTEAKVDEHDVPQSPASVCVEGPPQRQCYTAPQGFGSAPAVSVIRLGKDTSALLFSAESVGVSGWTIHYALLQPGPRQTLENILMSDISISNQGQKAFWNDPALSDEPIFVVADFVWGPDEAHYEPHRYIVSAYVRTRSTLLGGSAAYYLADQYMTVHKYDVEAHADILEGEKLEILARLRRLKR